MLWIDLQVLEVFVTSFNNPSRSDLEQNKDFSLTI